MAMKPSFEISTDVRKLIEFLLQRDMASYTEMSRLVNRELQGRERHVLESAKRAIQREHGIVFVAVRGLGIKRASNVQIASMATDHVHRKTKRTLNRAKKLDTLVNPQAMSNDARDNFYGGRMVNQALGYTLSRKFRSKIDKELADRGEQTDLTDVIALFSKRAH